MKKFISKSEEDDWFFPRWLVECTCPRWCKQYHICSAPTALCNAQHNCLKSFNKPIARESLLGSSTARRPGPHRTHNSVVVIYDWRAKSDLARQRERERKKIIQHFSALFSFAHSAIRGIPRERQPERPKISLAIL